MTALDSTLWQNDSGTVRKWTVDDAVRGTEKGDGDLPDQQTGAYWYLILSCDNPAVRMVVREGDLQTRLTDRDCQTWQQYDPRKRGSGVVEADPSDPYGPLRGQVSPTSPTDLTVEQVSGTGSRKTVNRFLQHPALVSHGLGSVHFWTSAWVARSPVDGSIVACIVLHRPAARTLDDGDTVEVRRLATRADRPANTASWLLARVRNQIADQWDTIQAYSGFAANRGVCYDAAGFDCVKQDTVDPEDTGWNDGSNRDGRVSVEGTWTRRRWEYDLTG